MIGIFLGLCYSSGVKHTARTYWILLFLRRLSFFLFVLTFILVMLYLAGNFQDFLDSTLLNLLELIETTALTGGVATFFLLLVSLFFGLAGRSFSVGVWILQALALFTLVLLLFSVKFLLVWF